MKKKILSKESINSCERQEVYPEKPLTNDTDGPKAQIVPTAPPTPNAPSTSASYILSETSETIETNENEDEIYRVENNKKGYFWFK